MPTFRRTFPVFINRWTQKSFQTLLIMAFVCSCEQTERHEPASRGSTVQANTNQRVARVHDGRLVNKLLFSESDMESDRVAPLKSSINQLLESLKSQQALTAASVYYLDLSTGDWFTINASEGYTPGSLLKLPVSLTFLKKAESDPRLLEQMVYCNVPPTAVPDQTFEIEPIMTGQSYPLAELLKRVLKYSDNISTSLINVRLDFTMLDKLYRDLGQSTPDMFDKSYVTNVVDYSRFLNVLYNGSWLSPANSELVLGWLTESSFRDGMVKHLPDDVLVARKFGEFGTNQNKQWHESGVVYAPNGHYVLTVMTKGKEADKLRYAIAEVSKLVYENRRKP